MALASLDLDLEVFQGRFDLLLTLVLREEVDLLEVDLASVGLAYVEHLEGAGELGLESGFRSRADPLPPGVRRVSLDMASKAYEGDRLAQALAGLLRVPPKLDLRHMRRPTVSVEQRLAP